jgi:hypothetical protein
MERGEGRRFSGMKFVMSLQLLSVEPVPVKASAHGHTMIGR